MNQKCKILHVLIVPCTLGPTGSPVLSVTPTDTICTTPFARTLDAIHHDRTTSGPRKNKVDRGNLNRQLLAQLDTKCEREHLTTAAMAMIDKFCPRTLPSMRAKIGTYHSWGSSLRVQNIQYFGSCSKELRPHHYEVLDVK